MVYFIPAYMLGMILLSIRAGNMRKKFYAYLEEKYPEFMDEVESMGMSSIVWSKGLYREYDVADPVLQSLKKEAKDAEDLSCMGMLIPILALAGYVALCWLLG